MPRMREDTKSQNKHQVLVRSKFEERRMEIVTLMWIGFFIGILLGGITTLMPR